MTLPTSQAASDGYTRFGLMLLLQAALTTYAGADQLRHICAVQ